MTARRAAFDGLAHAVGRAAGLGAGVNVRAAARTS